MPASCQFLHWATGPRNLRLDMEQKAWNLRSVEWWVMWRWHRRCCWNQSVFLGLGINIMWRTHTLTLGGAPPLGPFTSCHINPHIDIGGRPPFYFQRVLFPAGFRKPERKPRLQVKLKIKQDFGAHVCPKQNFEFTPSIQHAEQ